MYSVLAAQNGLAMNKALSVLFRQLYDNKIKYILITDFECEMLSHDLDLFVHPHYQHHFEEELHRLGWYIRKEPTHHVNHHFYFSPDSDIYLDVKYSLSFANGHNHCYTYKNQENVFDNAVLNPSGIYRPSGNDAVILYAAHIGYKERGILEEKHKRLLTSYLTNYQPETTAYATFTIEKIHLWLENSFSMGLEELKLIIAPYFKYEAKRMVRKRQRFKYGYGLKVLFLGTDGAGKTTLVEAVNKKLNLKTKKLYLGMGETGWSSTFIKNLYGSKFRSRLINRLFKLFKLFVILPTEFILRIIPVKLQAKYAVVLIDRFPGFVFLDRKSVRKFIYQSILPKPDLVFFLYADPEELVRRKPEEVTLERSRADIAKFRNVADVITNGKYIDIDTSQLTIEEGRDLIISEIYRHSQTHLNLFKPTFNSSK